MSFVNGLLLAGLVGAAAPIVIHWLTRPRPRQIALPTYALLVESGRGRQSLHRLREWIVLLLRCVAAAAIAILFARPLLDVPPAAGDDAADADGRRVVFLLDASLSMRSSPDGVSLFDAALAEASAALRALGPGDEAGVILLGATPRPLLPALTTNHGALRERLATAAATHEAGSPAAGLAAARAMLAGEGSTEAAAASGGAGGEVVVFSDFQATNWRDASAGAAANAGAVDYLLRPVTETGVGNLGLVAVDASPAEPVVGERQVLRATVFNASPRRRVSAVHLRLPGVTQTRRVELEPYAEATASFDFAPAAAGAVAARVWLDGDALPADDERFVRLAVRDRLRVLLISDADASDTGAAAFYVRQALAPRLAGRSLDDRPVEVVTRRSVQVDRGSLETADLFVVAMPARLTAETCEVVARRVREGVGLLCFVDGERAGETVAALAAAGAAADAGPGGASTLLPPFTLDAFARLPQRRPLGPGRTSHPALALFADPQSGRLGAMAVSRHWRATPRDGREHEVLWRHDDGSPALAVWRVGDGAAAAVNVPVAPSGGNVAASPLFPALLHELVRTLRDTGRDEAGTPGVAWTLSVPGDADAVGGSYRLIRHVEAEAAGAGPRGDGVEPLATEVLRRGRRDTLAVATPTTPGAYDVIRSPSDAWVDVAVVNFDRAETDTRPLAIDGLASRLGGDGAAGGVRVADGGAVRHVHADRGTELWPWALFVAATALAVECGLLGLWRRPPMKAEDGLDPALGVGKGLA